jgi:hypothetical protein
MPITVKHLKVSTIPDTTDTDLVRPSDWNADHTIVGTNDIANGGTNSTATPTAGAVAYGTGTAYAFSTAGTAGQVLQSNGTSAPSWVTAPAAGAGGSNTQIQFNNAGVLAGNSTYTMVSGVMKENGFNFVSQADVGSNPNQVPLNQYLGNMAYQDNAGVNLTGDAKINTVTVGLGGGNVATNTIVGNGALAANTTGFQSVAVGYQAGNATTTSSGVGVTFVGYQAGLKNTTGYNDAFGWGSLAAVTTTNGNAAFGYASLNKSTSSSNSAFGFAALNVSTSGGQNTALGNSALRSNTTGSNNTAIGGSAGYGATSANANTIGNNNTYIGYQTVGSANNNTNEMVIGYNSVGLGTNTTVIGNTSTTLTQTYGITKSTNYTVATLPSASTSGVGARAFVTDALAPAFGVTVVTGGAVPVPVFSDGTNWKVG